MGESTDQIRREIDNSRTQAAGKIDQLQSQVQGTAEGLRSDVHGTTEDIKTAVQETVEHVRDQVGGTVDDTFQAVKDNVDLRQMIEERPLVALGAAMLGGFVLGGLMNGEQQTGSQVSNPDQGNLSLGSGLRAALQKSGIEDTLASAAAALVGNLSDQLKDTLDRNMPGVADKMEAAQETPGSFADKARQAQSATL